MQLLLTNGLNQQNSKVGKSASKSGVSHSSQYPRAAALCIDEVEDDISIDHLITSASMTGRPIPDFENLDFMIASGLRKILTGTVKKQVTTAEGKVQSREEITYGQTDCFDDLRLLQQLVATMKLSWTSEIYRMFNFRKDNIQAFDTKWTEVLTDPLATY